jgi:glyceraldehyde 3-phosphate dehydrogenase
VSDVNELFRNAAASPVAGILGFETWPLVSAYYDNGPYRSIVDALSVLVKDDTLLKVYTLYDNKAGYACRMVDLANIVIGRNA